MSDDVMTTKEAFVQDLHEVSEGLYTLINAKFGSVSRIKDPISSIEAAIIVQGKMAANFNNAILVPLSGLPIVEAMLRSGQYNPSIQCLLLSMLQTTGATGGNDFAVNFSDKGTYPVGKQQLIVKINAGQASAASANIYGADAISFDCNKGADSPDFIGDFEIKEAGDYTMTVAVEYQGEPQPKTKDLALTFSAAETPAEPEEPAEDGA